MNFFIPISCYLTVVVPTVYCCILAVFIDPSTHAFIHRPATASRIFPLLLSRSPRLCLAAYTMNPHDCVPVRIRYFVYLPAWCEHVLALRVYLRSFTHTFANLLFTVILVHCAAVGSGNEGSRRDRIPSAFKKHTSPQKCREEKKPIFILIGFVLLFNNTYIVKVSLALITFIIL